MNPADWSKLTDFERKRLIAKQSKGFGSTGDVKASTPRRDVPVPQASRPKPERKSRRRRRWRSKAATPTKPRRVGTLAFDCEGFVLISGMLRQETLCRSDIHAVAEGLDLALRLGITDIEVKGEDEFNLPDVIRDRLKIFRHVEVSWRRLACDQIPEPPELPADTSPAPESLFPLPPLKG